MNDQPNHVYASSNPMTAEPYHSLPLDHQKSGIWKRILVFLFIFIVSASVSLVYLYSRPAVYQSDAELIIASRNPNLRDQDTSPHDIALQRQVLLSRDFLTKVLESLSNETQFPELGELTLSAMRSMLQVQTDSDSAIIKLVARGAPKAVLPVIVNTWLNRYIDLNSQMQKDYSVETQTSLEQQLENIKKKVLQKSDELAAFRKRHDIVSMSRDENNAMSKLKGLIASLNKASEMRVIAEANLKAIQGAIEQNKWAGNYKKTLEMNRYEEEAELLREQVKDLESIYTLKFIQMDKDTRIITKRLSTLEDKIRTKKQELQTAALEAAEQEIASSQAAEEDLKKQISANEKKVSVFSQRFAKHESLKQDLQRLEELKRDFQEKLVAVEIKSDTDMLQVKVIETAALPEKPVQPDYTRDAAIGVGASLLLAICSLLLYDFLIKPGKKKDHQAIYPVTYTQILQNPSPVLQASQHHDPATSLLPSVDPTFPRELSETEVQALYTLAGYAAKLCIASLFNGLIKDDIVCLQWHHISLETGEIKTPGSSPRILQILPSYKSILEKGISFPVDPDLYLLQDEQGRSFSTEKLDEKIRNAARRANLDCPEDISSDVLRYTYIAFLARQGVSLSEIVERVGHIPAEFHDGFERLHPSGSIISIQNAEIEYPAFKT